MTRDEALEAIWEAHDRYCARHPAAESYTCDEFTDVLFELLPTAEARVALLEALEVELCPTCITAQGDDSDTYCPFCAAWELALVEDDAMPEPLTAPTPPPDAEETPHG